MPQDGFDEAMPMSRWMDSQMKSSFRPPKGRIMDALQEDGVLEAGPDGSSVVVDPASQLLCREVRFHGALLLSGINRRRV